MVLIDNAYPGTFPELYARIENAFQQEGREVNIDVIVQNHAEKDHSGLLVELHEKFPQAPIYCTKIALSGLLKHFPALKGAEFLEVCTGQTLELGGKTLAFLEAFLLHWPDSMLHCLWKTVYYSLTTLLDNICASHKDTIMKIRICSDGCH